MIKIPILFISAFRSPGDRIHPTMNARIGFLAWLLIASSSVKNVNATPKREVEALAQTRQYNILEGERDHGTFYAGGAKSAWAEWAVRTATAKASAHSQWGVLKASGSCQASAPGGPPNTPSSHSSGYAMARFSENLRFEKPGYTGQTGTVTLRYYCHGNLTVMDNPNYGTTTAGGAVSFKARLGFSHANYSISGSSYIPFQVTHEDARGLVTGNEAPDRNIILVRSDFTWGLAIFSSFEVIAGGSSVGHIGGTAGVTADAGHTGYYAGIESIEMNGVPVFDYAIISESNTDYTKSFVPDPSLKIEPATGSVVLKFMSDSLSRYQIKISHDMKIWENHGDIITGTGEEIMLTHSIDEEAPKAFFRVEHTGFITN